MKRTTTYVALGVHQPTTSAAVRADGGLREPQRLLFALVGIGHKAVQRYLWKGVFPYSV